MRYRKVWVLPAWEGPDSPQSPVPVWEPVPEALGEVKGKEKEMEMDREPDHPADLHHYDIHESVDLTYDHIEQVHGVTPIVRRRGLGQGAASMLGDQHMLLHGDEPARSTPVPLATISKHKGYVEGLRFYRSQLEEHIKFLNGKINAEESFIAMAEKQWKEGMPV